MSRIYDYSSFSSSNTGSSRGEYAFGLPLKYVDIDIYNRPDEYANIEDAKVFIEYSVNLEVQKECIAGINFLVNSVELEFSVDDYPNPIKQFDIDLIPGKTIDIGQMKSDIGENPIPTNPTGIKINMNMSTDPKKFDVIVSFGS